MDKNHYFFTGSVFQLTTKFSVFVEMLMRHARIRSIIHISIFGAFSAEKSAHYTQLNTLFIYLFFGCLKERGS